MLYIYYNFIYIDAPENMSMKICYKLTMNILPENHARAEVAVETFDVVLNLFQLVLELGENVFPHVTFCFKFLPRQFAKILLCLCDFNDGIDLIFHLHVRVFPSENHGHISVKLRSLLFWLMMNISMALLSCLSLGAGPRMWINPNLFGISSSCGYSE